jgi:uncharacterized protein YciI
MRNPSDTDGPVDRTRLLGRDYWLVNWLPAEATTATDIEAHLDDHLRWLLELELAGVLVMSGPLVDGPRVAPGSGITVLRCTTEADAREISSADPFVRQGLRTFELLRWRINEGSITVQLFLGTGTYQWL